MAGKAGSNQFFNHKSISKSLFGAFIVGSAFLVLTPSALSETSDLSPNDRPALDELKDHASTIDEILSEASRRVDQLASEGKAPAALIDAIRQELSLSRRWNQHLATILLDVAEAKQELGRREREAALEIARMTAVAEEARLELVALKEVLGRRSESVAPDPEERSDHSPVGPSFIDLASIGEPSLETLRSGLLGPGVDLRDARETLAAVEAAQETAAHDVDAVRSKIIEALQTLGEMSGHHVTVGGTEDGNLTSKDITGWAASMTTKLQQSDRKP